MEYNIRYQIERGHFTKEDRTATQGLTQSLVIHSCIEHEDGSYSQQTYSYDGLGEGQLDPNKLFKAWMMFTQHLVQTEGLPAGKRQFCADVVDAMRTVILAGQDDAETSC